jgi:large subunit ribosomal protein L17
MRHRVAFRKLNRTTSHRLAMLGNMVSSLLEHEAIRTTLPKAKEARRIAERIITLGKRGGLSNVRLAARTIHNKTLLSKVFGDLKDRYAERPGGYTRIIRLGYRPGDSAEVALLELVDRPAAEEKAEKTEKAEKAEKKSKAERSPGPEEKKAKGEAPESEAKPRKKAKKEVAAKADEPKSKPSKARASKERAEEKRPQAKAKKSGKSK